MLRLLIVGKLPKPSQSKKSKQRLKLAPTIGNQTGCLIWLDFDEFECCEYSTLADPDCLHCNWFASLNKVSLVYQTV